MSGLATLVIGVGGTGLKVLQYVKERLLETYAGEVPPHIGLLAFDTEPPPLNGAEGGVALTMESSFIGVAQDPRPAEFRLLSPSPVNTLTGVIREAHNGDDRWAWLEADKAAALLPSPQTPQTPSVLPAASRPFRRIRLQLNYEQVKEALHQALHNLHQAVGAPVFAEDQTPNRIHQHTRHNIFLVGSFAGSTGAGILIDIAVLLRSITKSENYSSYSLIAMIALPSCFAGHVDTSGRRLSNSYAALRELDRFMRGHTAATPCCIKLPDGNTTTLDNMLFDLCYLVDAQDYKGAARAISADTGALAAMADTIATHIDLRCGLRLNAANINVPATYHHSSTDGNSGEGYHYQPRRLYSALNTHTVIFPREDVIRSLGLRFLLEMLKTHLAQQAAYTSGLAVPTTPVKVEEVLGFLSKDNPTQQEKAQIELPSDMDVGVFLRTLLRHSAKPDSKYTTTSADILAWLVEDGKTRGEIQKMLDQSLKEITQPVSEQRSLPHYRQRTQDWIARYLPSLANTSQPQEQVQGEWFRALRDVPTVIRPVLRNRVHDLVVSLLNQRQVENVGAQRYNLLRANRPGYALGVLDALKQRMRLFKRQTEASFEQQIKSREKLRREWRQMHAEFKTLEPNVPFFAHNPGPDYLKQLHELAMVEWKCLLCQCILDITTQLGGDPGPDGELSIIDSAKRAVGVWATTFTTLHDDLAEMQQQHDTRRQAKHQIKTRSYVTDRGQFPAAAQVEERLYTACRDRLWRAFLGTGDSNGMGLEWQSGADAYMLTIGNTSFVPSADPSKPVTDVAQDAQNLIAFWQTYTLQLVADLIRQDQQARVASHITALVNDAQAFVKHWLQPHRCALIRLPTAIQPDSRQEEHYLAVDPTSDDRTVSGFYSWIRNNWQQTGQEYIEAESEVACTFLTLYHGLEMAHVASFVESEASYRTLLRRGESLHLFREEQHAAAYEARMPTLATPEWQRVRWLHPQIVVCLHTPDYVQAFALALVSGLITLQRVEQSEAYVFQPADTLLIQLSDSANIVHYQQISQRQLDRQAALLLDAFQTWMLRGHAINNVYESINYAAIQPAFQNWFATAYGEMGSRERSTLVRTWETNRDSMLAPLLHAESHDPRFRDLGIVLLLELYAWAESPHV